MASTAFPQSAWQRIGVNDGLAQGFIGAVLEDSRGFIWFGTKEGLSRYDGNTFKNYRNDPSDSTTIFPDLILELHECTSGLIWIGFESGNIDLFDGTTEQFVHLREIRSVPLTPVYSIVEEKPGIHWIGRADGGLLRIEGTIVPGKDLSGTAFRMTRNLQMNGLSPESLRWAHSLRDHTDGVWIFSTNGIHVFNRTVPRLPDIPYKSDPRKNARHTMAQDRDGNIWFSFGPPEDYHVYSFNPTTGVTTKIPIHTPRSHTSVFLYGSDRSDFIWLVGTDEIVRIHARNPLQYEIIKPPYPLRPTEAIIESGGLLWIGTDGFGVDRYNPAVERFGVVPKVLIYDLANSAMEQIGFPRSQDDAQRRSPYADLYDMVVFRDHSGKEWYPWNPKGVSFSPSLTTSDVLRYDPATRTMDRFRRQEDAGPLSSKLFPTSPPVKLLEDRTGARWFVGANVLSVYDSALHGFRHFTIVNGELVRDPKFIRSYELMIGAARKDQDGSFWLCVDRVGLFRFDPVTLSLKGFFHDDNDSTSLSSNNVISMAEDPAEPNRFLWIGTDGGGLNKFEKATGLCTRITTHNGLPNNVVYTIFPDKKGKLWMSTNNGLCTMDPRTMKFRYYDVNDGLQGLEFNRYRNYQTPDGKIYIEGTDGVNVFYPEDITENTHVPPVMFTDLKLYGKSISWKDAGSPLKNSIGETKEIVLSFEQNIITFEFAALDFSNSPRNQYSYRLEGFSDEWTKPSSERVATFTNLSPGSYTLRVRGSNNDGIWNETGASLSLIVLPPWYKTWWAYSCYAGLLLTGLFMFRRYDLKRIRLKDQFEIEHTKAEHLKEVDQLKMQFFQNISHEFRTPLTLILGPIEKLLGGSIPEDTQKRELRMMRRNAQRLLRLINQLLDLSKLEAGGMKLQASKGNLIAFIKGITMSFHSLAERKEIFLDVHADVEEIEIYFDKEKLEKIIINLLSNAFKFTPDHGEITVSLTLTPRRVESSTVPSPNGRGVAPTLVGDGVRVSIRDTGIGIAPEKLPHIFDRFYQADSSTTRSQEGTGIGLALVKDLVELHHGTITVTSEPGKGSEFVVSLPLGKSHLKPEEIVDASVGAGHVLPILEESETQRTEIHHPAENESQSNIDDKPILLIIEDNSDVRDYIKSYLVPMYTVLEAADGAEGVERAKEAIPDLIISDVMMPKMDGYEVCSRLKQDEKTSHVPIILLTAKAAKEDKIGGLETGADDYLIKPFDSAELLVRVKNLIESRRKLREKFGKELVTLKPGEVAVTSVDQAFLKKVMDAIEKKIGDEQFGVSELADAIGLSSKQLQRKLKGLANTSANDFIRSFRLHRAKELLQKDSSTIAEIAYSVGFGSPAYFTKCFQEQFGATPSETRKPSS